MFWKSKKKKASEKLADLQERLKSSEHSLRYFKSIDAETHINRRRMFDWDYDQLDYEIKTISDKLVGLDKLQPTEDLVKEEIDRRKSALKTDKYLLELRVEEKCKEYREDYYNQVKYYEKEVTDLLSQLESL